MVTELDLARAAGEAALGVEGVHSLGVGRYVEAATYEGPEKFVGAVVTPEDISVHVVALYPLKRSLPELAREIREAVAASTGTERVNVVIEDLRAADEAI